MTNNTGSSYSNQIESPPDRELSLEEWNKLRHSKAKAGNSLISRFVSSSFGHGLCWGGIFALTAVVSATLGASLTHFHLVSDKITSLIAGHTSQDSFVPSNSIKTTDTTPLTRPVNLLVVGVNSINNSPENSTVVFLFRFQPEDNFVSITSIPQDSRVKIPEIGLGTIQKAYSHGGLEMVSQVVSKTLDDVEIDRYIKATPTTLLNLIDLLGGVEVFVPPDVDSQGKQKISSISGWQTLDGKQTVEFMAQNSQDKINQIQQHQILIEAVRQRLHHPSFATDLTQTVQTLKNYLDTDLTFTEMKSLLSFLHQLERDEVTVKLIPKYDRQPKPAQNNFIISNQKSDRPTSHKNSAYSGYAWRNIPISIQNTTKNPELSLKVLEYLIGKGFYNVYLNKHSPLQLSQTEIITETKDLVAATYLQQILNIGELEVLNAHNSDSELTIRLGKDAKIIFLDEGFIK